MFPPNYIRSYINSMFNIERIFILIKESRLLFLKNKRSMAVTQIATSNITTVVIVKTG